MPKKGSLQESVLILLQLKKDDIEHQKLRTIAQIILDKEKGVEVFKEYIEAAYPWLEKMKSREKDEMIKHLKEAMSLGPVSISPMRSEKARSRTQVRRAQPAPPTPAVEQRAAANSLMKKIGKVVPR